MGTRRHQLRADGNRDPSTRQMPPRASRSFPTLNGFTPSPHLPTHLSSVGSSLLLQWRLTFQLPAFHLETLLASTLLPSHCRVCPWRWCRAVKMTTGVSRVVLVSSPLHPPSSAWPRSQACGTPAGVLGSRLSRSREKGSESLRGAAQRRSGAAVQSSGSKRCQQRSTRCGLCQRSLHPHLKNGVHAFAHMMEQAYTGDKQPLFQQFCQT